EDFSDKVSMNNLIFLLRCLCRCLEMNWYLLGLLLVVSYTSHSILQMGVIMDFNFELILFYALALSGIIALLDIVYFAPKRKKQQSKKMPLVVDYARSFFPILLLVFSM